jgi:hypothetical protein
VPKKPNDITLSELRRWYRTICCADEESALTLLEDFGERWRKNYVARKQRERLQQSSETRERQRTATKKWYAANKEERIVANRIYNQSAYREKAEKEWREGKRKRKPRVLDEE